MNEKEFKENAEWFTCDEKLPEDGQEVIVRYAFGVFFDSEGNIVTDKNGQERRDRYKDRYFFELATFVAPDHFKLKLEDIYEAMGYERDEYEYEKLPDMWHLYPLRHISHWAYISPELEFRVNHDEPGTIVGEPYECAGLTHETHDFYINQQKEISYGDLPGGRFSIEELTSALKFKIGVELRWYNDVYLHMNPVEQQANKEEFCKRMEPVLDAITLFDKPWYVNMEQSLQDKLNKFE